MPTLNFKDSNKKFDIKNVYCLGLNYKNHAEEFNMNLPKEPVVFMKPTSSVINDGQNIIIPKISNNCHYEVELVLVIGSMSKIIGYAVGIDATLRDVQAASMKNNMPWLVSKGFYTSAPISQIIPASQIIDPYNLTLNLYVNDELKQTGNTSDLIFKLNDVIEYMSSIFTLQEGDVIFTGTPEGVGPINKGDKLRAEIKNIVELQCGVL